MAHLNINRLRFKIDCVRELVYNQSLLLLAVTETWLTDDVSDGEISIPGFYLFRRDRPGKAGGGVCVYVHHSLQPQVLPNISHPDIEMLWLRIVGRDKSSALHFGCLYRPPSERVQFWSDLEGSLEELVGLDILLMGDFNVDVLDPFDQNYSHLMAVYAPLQLANTVSVPTRVCNTSRKCIDPLLTNCAFVLNVVVPS